MEPKLLKRYGRNTSYWAHKIIVIAPEYTHNMQKVRVTFFVLIIYSMVFYKIYSVQTHKKYIIVILLFILIRVNLI